MDAMPQLFSTQLQWQQVVAEALDSAAVSGAHWKP
jgi:hypothetical protein